MGGRAVGHSPLDTGYPGLTQNVPSFAATISLLTLRFIWWSVNPSRYVPSYAKRITTRAPSRTTTELSGLDVSTRLAELAAYSPGPLPCRPRFRTNLPSLS